MAGTLLALQTLPEPWLGVRSRSPPPALRRNSIPESWATPSLRPQDVQPPSLALQASQAELPPHWSDQVWITEVQLHHSIFPEKGHPGSDGLSTQGQ